MPDGKRINNSNDITSFLINYAKVALVPFSAFGAATTSNWFRLSIGTAHLEDIEQMFVSLRKALALLGDWFISDPVLHQTMNEYRTDDNDCANVETVIEQFILFK